MLQFQDQVKAKKQCWLSFYSFSNAEMPLLGFLLGHPESERPHPHKSTNLKIRSNMISRAPNPAKVVGNDEAFLSPDFVFFLKFYK